MVPFYNLLSNLTVGPFYNLLSNLTVVPFYNILFNLTVGPFNNLLANLTVGPFYNLLSNLTVGPLIKKLPNSKVHCFWSSNHWNSEEHIVADLYSSPCTNPSTVSYLKIRSLQLPLYQPLHSELSENKIFTAPPVPTPPQWVIWK